MSKAVPAVQKYMSYPAVTIDAAQDVRHAHKLMRENRVRHLPVVKGGKVVGVVSDGDLWLKAAVQEPGEAAVLSIESAMSPDPFCVSPTSPLDEVVEEMARRKYGSAVVVDHGNVVGMFTAVDAQQALADLLHQRFHR